MELDPIVAKLSGKNAVKREKEKAQELRDLGNTVYQN